MAGLAADDRAARRQVVDLAVDQRPGLVRMEHDLGGEAVGLEHHEADRLAAAAVPGRRPEAGLLDAGIGQLAEGRRRAVAAGLAQIGRLAFSSAGTLASSSGKAPAIRCSSAPAHGWLGSNDAGAAGPEHAIARNTAATRSEPRRTVTTAGLYRGREFDAGTHA